MGKSVDDFKASDRSLIQYAVAMYETDIALENAEKEHKGKLAVVRPAGDGGHHCL